MGVLATTDLNLLRALDLLLDERSVRGAARRAHVSPSAMSHTLGRLRELLGDPVLVRAGHGMVPTARAEALALPTKELLARARALLTDPAFDPATLRRRFRLVCTDHVSTVLLGPVDAMLREEAPGVDLVVAPLVPETMEDLRRGQVDAAVGLFPDAGPEVRSRRLFEDRFVTVCRPEHALRELNLEAFLAASHALVSPRGGAEGLVDEVLARDGHARRVARVFPSFLAAIWHVRRSDDLLTVSERLVRAVSRDLPLRALPCPLDLAPYPLWLVWHPRSDASPEDAWFRDLLVRAAAG